jgi:hypothetical protein
LALTRDELQRVATHVLARRRHALCGKFGLRATPGGISTPHCGPEHETLRISGTTLIRERAGASASTASLELTTASLKAAAALAEVDLDAPFEVGHDTPPLGDTAAPLAIDPVAAAVLAEWFRFGWALLDRLVAGAGPGAQPSVVQLWPEHFDAACDLGVGGDRRANFGASPGDGFHDGPYLYVGPWSPERPGDPSFWNAPFGAIVGYEELRAAPDPLAAGLSFFTRGLDLLRG